MLPSYLKSDCSRCVALCCSAFALTTEQGFPFDKPANAPCPELRDDYRCAIHERRHLLGFAPCAAYDCYGAGQWTTQRFCGELGLREPVAAEMFDAFRTVAAIHELLAILALSHVRASTDAQREVLRECERSMLALREDASDPAVRQRIAAEKNRVLEMLWTQRTPTPPLPR